MKIAAAIILTFVAAIIAAPTSISDNNIGNVVNVGISASVNVSNKVDQDIVKVIVAYLTQQGVVIAPSEAPVGSQQPSKLNITPEMIEKVTGL